MTEPAAAGRWLVRAGQAIAFVVSVLVLAAIGLRVLYSSELGFLVADAIPRCVWRWLDAWYANRYGPPDGERAQDTAGIALGLVSLLVALAVVTATTVVSSAERVHEPTRT